MKKFASLFLVIFFGAFMTVLSSVAQEDEPLTEAEIVALIQAGTVITANKSVQENYALCPLQRGRLGIENANWRYGQFDDYCRQSVDRCLSACLADDSGACRDLAGVFEDFQDIDEIAAGDVSRRLHAQACALGDANACTNRAAGIVNARRDDDPVEPLSDAKRAQCTIVMYEDACNQNEYWGCSQIALERSESGHESIRDEQKAIAAGIKACKIDAEIDGTDPTACEDL